MRPDELRSLLEATRTGDMTVEEAVGALRELPVEDLGFARLDTHRELRQGLPEGIYAEGKQTHEVIAIAERLLERATSPVLATRVDSNMAPALIAAFPTAIHHERGRIVVFGPERTRTPTIGTVAIVSAGTSDLGVAEEASVTATAYGAEVHQVTDVGVAGLHRVLSVQDELHSADVVIVVAGMEGALASIIGGISSAPVIAVPTSVGYGSSFDGLAALLAMLNSCAAGVAVMNIDNGFGAASFALRLLTHRSS